MNDALILRWALSVGGCAMVIAAVGFMGWFIIDLFKTEGWSIASFCIALFMSGASILVLALTWAMLLNAWH
jgi:hypothetical protein